MNLLKILNLYKGNLLGLNSVSRLLRVISGLLKVLLELRKSKWQLTLKPISLRLNIKLYNKLSKEVEDFKDYKDEYIYTQH